MSNAVPRFRSEIRPATYSDCLTLAPNLRQEDKDEVWESSSYLPEEALIESFKATEEPMVGTVDGDIVCMFGVAAHSDEECGIPWLLGTERIKEFSKEFLALNKPVLGGLSSKYKYLANYAWSKNVTHLRWLKWLGFSIDKTPVSLGINQEIFFYFYMQTKD